MMYYKLPKEKYDILIAPFFKASYEVAEPYIALLRSLEVVEASTEEQVRGD